MDEVVSDMEWKQRRAKLRELGSKAREQPEEAALVVASSIEAIDDELDRLHKNRAHIPASAPELPFVLFAYTERVEKCEKGV